MSAPLPVLEARLDATDVDDLFGDVAALAEVEWVQADLEGPEGNSAQAISLEDAARWLRAGRARRVLLRYRHDGLVWCDTLLADSAGVRLLRMQVPEEEPRPQEMSPSPAQDGA